MGTTTHRGTQLLPPLSASSNEIQRAETTPWDQSDKGTLGSVCHTRWQSQWKSSTCCSFNEIPCKRHLLTGRWGAAAKAQIFADAVLLNPVSSTDCTLRALEPLPVSRRHREIPLYPSQAPTRNLTAAPAFQSHGKEHPANLLSHGEREEHHSWNQGMMDKFWSSWHCTDQQTRLSKN